MEDLPGERMGDLWPWRRNLRGKRMKKIYNLICFLLFFGFLVFWNGVGDGRSVGWGRGRAVRARPAISSLFRSKVNSQIEGNDCAKIIDGKSLAAKIRESVKQDVEDLQSTYGKNPGLGVVIVGDRPDSRTYVNRKKKAAAEVGIESFEVSLPEGATESQVINEIQKLEKDPNVHGILVQLPLPSHMNEDHILRQIPVHKDVDGFSSVNIGELWLRSRTQPKLDANSNVPVQAVPCTAAGVLEMLKSLDVPLAGKKAVVLGRSRIVGMPVAGLLLALDCTVTVVHSATENPEEHIKRADIVIAALGIPEYVKGEWLKPGSIVIDVGINSIEDATKKRGYRLVGDVDFPNAKNVCGYISPVPGGVGPMTVAMLLRNTVQLARNLLTPK